NVGSIFRTADGAGVEHLYLCGITATPDNPRLKKTALGAHESVPWSFHRNAFEAAQELKSSGISLWALEGGPSSEPISHACRDPDGNAICLVVGNEICGVDPGILSMCEKIIGIPMGGIKTSLNTAVAFGIAVYMIRFEYGRQVRSPSSVDERAHR
ncbi:MAG: TrmH family RNA methyltransferase, partial [Desulfomonilia bacterium]|nr:TrmH family RNA methyltransferase [Desulfomonilia bacterium]